MIDRKVIRIIALILAGVMLLGVFAGVMSILT